MNKENISQNAIDEALEIIWTLEEQGIKNSENFHKKYRKELKKIKTEHIHQITSKKENEKQIDKIILKILRKRNYVKDNGKNLELTEKGRKKARNIVRRHRLAERLMVDVLDMGKEEVEKPACEFEHLLSEEVTNRICTLLGHPQECPHGMPIPPGKCCEEERETIKPTVIPLNKAKVGKELKVAYIQTKDHPRLHKLLSYDIGPGSKIKLHQKTPSYIIRIGQTDIAFEKNVVKDIYVKPLTQN